MARGKGRGNVRFLENEIWNCQKWGRETGVVKTGFSTLWKRFRPNNRGDLARVWKSGKNMEKLSKIVLAFFGKVS